MTDKKLIDINPIPESTRENLLNPASKSVGNALGTVCDSLFNLILMPLRKYNVIKENDLNDFKLKVESKSNEIPIENRDDSKIGLALKTIEDVRYQFDEEIMREMFANLLTATLDNRVNNDVIPIFSHLLANMSPGEAKLLKTLKENDAVLPLVEVTVNNSKSSIENKLSKNRFNPNELMDMLGLDNLEISIDSDIILMKDKFSSNEGHLIESLEANGLIVADRNVELEADKHQKMYNLFENSDYYTGFNKELPMIIDDIEFSNLSLKKGRFRLSLLGFKLVKIILP